MIQMIKDFLRWRKLDHDEKCIATAKYETTVVRNDGAKTGEVLGHVVEFWADGNGKRWSRTATGHQAYADRHKGITFDRSAWRHHGELPDHAKRVDGGPRGKLIAIQGGKDGAS